VAEDTNAETSTPRTSIFEAGKTLTTTGSVSEVRNPEIRPKTSRNRFCWVEGLRVYRANFLLIKP
ncbi:hypothetical protein OAA27_02395, partial [bacterium]|nr:hypothetical protein [bacterium]